MKFVEREWKSRKIVLKYLEVLELCMENGDKSDITKRVNELDRAVADILIKAEKNAPV